ncbi:hypothetical protein ABG067_003896 [Albugo candida]
MARFKLRFQLMCGWALCLVSLIKCEQSKCLVVTDGEPDDMVSIILMVKSPRREEICADGIIIILVLPTEDKKKFTKQIFETAKIKKVTIIDGSNSDAADIRKPLINPVPQSHEILKKELTNSNINFYILILAPLRDLSIVLCDMKEKDGARFDNIREIYWSGGWDSQNYEADFNLFIGAEHTLKFMNLIALEEKIHISSSQVSIYKGSMNVTSFPRLVAFLTQQKKRNALFQGLIEIQKKWDEFILRILNEMDNHELDGTLGKGIQFCPADILATMLMFHPDLRVMEEYKYYTVEVADLEPESKLPPTWKPMIVSVKSNDKGQAENEIEYQRASIKDGKKFHDYEILYKHQLYTKIADHSEQKESDFKERVISLLEQYVPEAQRTAHAH